jgi:hypothetical protein
MWNAAGASLPSVLIVENGSGDVYIVENKKTKPQVDKILKTEKSPRPSRRKQQELKIESRDPSPFDLK